MGIMKIMRPLKIMRMMSMSCIVKRRPAWGSGRRRRAIITGPTNGIIILIIIIILITTIIIVITTIIIIVKIVVRLNMVKHSFCSPGRLASDILKVK